MSDINTLIVENTKLIYQVMRDRYQKYIQDKIVSIEDLYSEGLLGLYKAARKFNPNKKVKFSTFAYLVIKQHMSHHLFRRVLNQPKHVSLDDVANETIMKRRITSNPNAELDLSPYLRQLPKEEAILIDSYYRDLHVGNYLKKKGMSWGRFDTKRKNILAKLSTIIPEEILS